MPVPTRTSGALIAMAVLAAAGATASVLLDGSARASTGSTARIADEAVTERVVALDEIDLGPKGSSPGDRLIITTRAFADGKRVGEGWSDNVVVRAHPRTPLYLVNSTLRLRDGDISVVGLYDSAQRKGLSFPIVGGIGRYAGLTGTQKSSQPSDDSYRSTFHFRR